VYVYFVYLFMYGMCIVSGIAFFGNIMIVSTCTVWKK